jgi:hypothetical protein
MNCNDDQDPSLEPRIDELFAALDATGAVGLARLHAIERDILEALRLRPRRTWCVGCARLLEGIVLKAQGDKAGLDKLFAQR